MTERHDGRTTGDAALERAVTAALEQAPQMAIPADFAARVAARAAVLPQRAATTPVRYGRRIALVAAFALAAALFALAPHAVPSATNFSFMMEMLILLQLGGLAYWFMLTERGRS